MNLLAEYWLQSLKELTRGHICSEPSDYDKFSQCIMFFSL